MTQPEASASANSKNSQNSQQPYLIINKRLYNAFGNLIIGRKRAAKQRRIHVVQTVIKPNVIHIIIGIAVAEPVNTGVIRPYVNTFNTAAFFTLVFVLPNSDL